MAETVRVRRRTATRLSERQVAALVDAYLAGATVYELAARFGIHRVTVSTHLHRQGVTVRRQGLDDEGVTHAIRVYEDGWSLTRIGDRLDIDPTTVWTALKAQRHHHARHPRTRQLTALPPRQRQLSVLPSGRGQGH